MGKSITIHQVIADNVIVTATPEFSAETTTELLFGEQVEILETLSDDDDEEWSKIRSKTDGYEGYVPSGLLDDEPTEPTHKVSALRTFALCEPDFKSPPLRCLSFMSPLSVVLEDQGFSLLDQGSWVYTDHIKAFSDTSIAPLEAALKFIETPYLWGGRSSLGLDCSALVQLALLNAELPCPRDTKDQVDAIGNSAQPDDIQKGDIVFFDGHVGMMVDDRNLLNATARHMKVVIEPLDVIAKAYGGIKAVKRI